MTKLSYNSRRKSRKKYRELIRADTVKNQELLARNRDDTSKRRKKAMESLSDEQRMELNLKANEYNAESRKKRGRWLAGQSVGVQQQDQVHQKALKTAVSLKNKSDIPPRRQSHSKELWEKRALVCKLVGQHQTLKSVLLKPLDAISGCDTASDTSGEGSYLGKHLRRIAVYNNNLGMWLELWIAADGYWTLYTWKLGEYGKNKAEGKMPVGVKVSVGEAQNRLRDFLGDTIVLQYNHCDLKRIQAWLRDSDKPLLQEKNWFDLYTGLNSKANSDLLGFFGRGRNAISPSADSTLSIVSWNLFAVDGGCIALPEEGTVERTNRLVPYLTEVDPKGKCFSDDALDVQKLFNLFVVIHTVYRASISTSSSSSN